MAALRVDQSFVERTDMSMLVRGLFGLLRNSCRISTGSASWALRFDLAATRTGSGCLDGGGRVERRGRSDMLEVNVTEAWLIQ